MSLQATFLDFSSIGMLCPFSIFFSASEITDTGTDMVRKVGSGRAGQTDYRSIVCLFFCQKDLWHQDCGVIVSSSVFVFQQ